MTQPSLAALEAVRECYARCDHPGKCNCLPLALDAFAAQREREVIERCADLCDSLGWQACSPLASAPSKEPSGGREDMSEREQQEITCLWRAIDILMQIVLRSALASQADRQAWEALVRERNGL